MNKQTVVIEELNNYEMDPCMHTNLHRNIHSPTEIYSTAINI